MKTNQTFTKHFHINNIRLLCSLRKTCNSVNLQSSVNAHITRSWPHKMSGLLDRFIANKRQFWREFLKLYQDMPELWDVHHPDYRNKELRNGSYDILHNKLREIQPTATKSDVGRRINIFRTNYRREQMRIWKQQELGLHADLCKPTLWFYDNMSFLLTQESFQRRARKMRCKPYNKPQPALDLKYNVSCSLCITIYCIVY